MDGSHYSLTSDDSLYYRYNSTMRGRVAADVELWADYSRIIDSALDKLPPQEVTVYRGFHVSLTQVSHEFQPGKVVWLVSVTSTTTDEKRTLKFFGSGSSSSPGTLMKIYALSARDIKEFSVLPTESELVFPLNTCLSIERVVSSQELMSLKGLIEDVPENVDLIVAREQRVSKDTVTVAVAKDAEDLSVFQSQHFNSSAFGSLLSASSSPAAVSPPSGPPPSVSLVSHYSPPPSHLPSPGASSFHPPPFGAPPSHPPAFAAPLSYPPPPGLLPSTALHLLPTASGHPPPPTTPASKPASVPLSSVSFPDALTALKSAVSDAAAASIAYYDDIEFAAQLCSDAATQHGTNYAISNPLQESCISLQRIVASKPPSVPSKVSVTSALADAESLLQADPGLKAARQKMKDACDKEAQRLRDDVSRAQQECQSIATKLQADEGDARSSAANEIRLLEQQLGVDAAEMNRMKDEESRALAAQDLKSAQAANTRAKAYVAECSQRLQSATAQRKLGLEEQLQQLRNVARDAAAAGQQAVEAKQSILDSSVAGHQNQLREFDASSASLAALIDRAQKLLGRQPAWPQHEALLRFDLQLQRLTTHMVFSKKWFPRFFCMRERRLYYSDGKKRHLDTQDGTLAFLQTNPAPDGRYCLDLQGMLTRAARYLVTLLRRLLCCRVQRASGRAKVRVRDQVPCRQPGARSSQARRVTATCSHTASLQAARDVVLAAADEVTRQRCMRIIEAASAGTFSPLQVIASAVALTRDLLDMKSLPAVMAVLAALGVAIGDASLKAVGLDPPSLKAAGHDISAFRAACCSWADIRTAGFTAAEAKAAGCDSTNAKSAGYHAKSLKDAGFDAAAFRTAGYSWADIRTAEFTAAEAKAAGCDSTNAKSAGYHAKPLKDAGFDAASLKTAGYDAKELKFAGFGAAAFRLLGYSWAEMKTAGFYAREAKAAGCDFATARSAGYDAYDLRLGGFEAATFRSGGYSWAEMNEAGFTAADAKAAGCSLATAKSAGFAVHLLVAAFGIDAVVASGCDVSSVILVSCAPACLHVLTRNLGLNSPPTPLARRLQPVHDSGWSQNR
jgi:ribosomal protein L13E